MFFLHCFLILWEVMYIMNQILVNFVVKFEQNNASGESKIYRHKYFLCVKFRAWSEQQVLEHCQKKSRDCDHHRPPPWSGMITASMVPFLVASLTESKKVFRCLSPFLIGPKLFKMCCFMGCMNPNLPK